MFVTVRPNIVQAEWRRNKKKKEKKNQKKKTSAETIRHLVLRTGCLTKSTYRSHRNDTWTSLPGCPCYPTPLTQYAAYLVQSGAISTMQQYLNIVLNIVCLLHLELGLQNPLKDNCHLQLVQRGIKRGKGCTVAHKMPLDLPHLLHIQSLLDLSAEMDRQFWAPILCCFFGFLRINNVTVATIHLKETLNA